MLPADGQPPAPTLGLGTLGPSQPPYLRFVLAVALFSTAGALYGFNEWFRSAEAAAGEHVIGLVTTGTTSLDWDSAVTFFGLGTPHAMGLRITAGCSSAMLIIPLLLVGAGFMLSRRSTISRILTGTVIGAAVLVATNQVRIALIASFSQKWGEEGFGWAHTVVGSILSLVGVAASVTALLLVAMRRQKRDDRLSGSPL
ncbi:archaeosortase/exosortase family protein [Streptomyces sp. AK02-04a]|uniref:archaeosortase/exosortase family protein n=1 Tax=Streptomyces sp. AK02-04a TaxID=3028649 RepID=UPI0029A069FB|nr:archaeosortase/exosortase family protein [Streptomyces sp. AK02-04a]MDX3763423.1 archaeosortase/exosortase family protein [Streptomyces sp. AK02-04a]